MTTTKEAGKEEKKKQRNKRVTEEWAETERERRERTSLLRQLDAIVYF